MCKRSFSRGFGEKPVSLHIQFNAFCQLMIFFKITQRYQSITTFDADQHTPLLRPNRFEANWLNPTGYFDKCTSQVELVDESHDIECSKLLCQFWWMPSRSIKNKKPQIPINLRCPSSTHQAQSKRTTNQSNRAISSISSNTNQNQSSKSQTQIFKSPNLIRPQPPRILGFRSQ